MHYFILIVLFGISTITPLYHVVIQNDHTSKENTTNKKDVMNDTDKKIIMNNNRKEWALQQESAYTVEGTITEILFADLSKTSRVESLVMELYLKTSDSPPKNLQFRRYHASPSNKQLRVGQRISIIARKDECLEECVDEYADILYLEPL